MSGLLVISSMPLHAPTVGTNNTERKWHGVHCGRSPYLDSLISLGQKRRAMGTHSPFPITVLIHGKLVLGFKVDIGPKQVEDILVVDLKERDSNRVLGAWVRVQHLKEMIQRPRDQPSVWIVLVRCKQLEVTWLGL